MDVWCVHVSSRKFTGKVEKGKENPYSCCVLAGMRSQGERRANLQVRRRRELLGGSLEGGR